MKQGQRLNLKFSIKEVDFIVGLARAGRTAEEISDRIGAVNIPFRGGVRSTTLHRAAVYPEDIQSICWQSGVKVRAADSA